jgi:hypothetical protein
MWHHPPPYTPLVAGNVADAAMMWHHPPPYTPLVEHIKTTLHMNYDEIRKFIEEICNESAVFKHLDTCLR